MARLGGQFPFPLTQVAEGTTRLTLASGGIFVLPANQYLIMTDTNSVVQYWDPQANSWQTLAGHSAAIQLTSDGANYRLLNDSGTIPALTIAGPNNSSGYTNGIGPTATGASLAFAAAPTGFPTATGYLIIGGTVAAPTVTQAGSAFQCPPLIVIDPPPLGGIQATAHCTLTAGGAINTIVMDSAGAGYVASPNFYIIPQPPYYTGAGSGGIAASPYPPGGLVHPNNSVPGAINPAPAGISGALLTPVALTGSGTITGAVRVNFGGGYSGAQSATVAGGGGTIGTTTITGTPAATAVATVILSARVNE
jgi:hypothetical protein